MPDVLTALYQSAVRYPDRQAVVGEHVALTYAELSHEVERISAELRSRGVRVLGLLADNAPSWIALDLAALQAGITLIPIPPFFTPAQIAHVISDAGADAVVSQRDFSGCASQTLTVTGEKYYWVVTGAKRKTLPEGTAKITYTSGTTGTPKGVCLSAHHLAQVALSLVSELGAELADRHVAVLPLAVLLENIAGAYATLIAGGTYLVPGLRVLGYSVGAVPAADKLFATLQSLGATSCILVPEMLRGLTDYMRSHGVTCPSLQIVAVGGARVSQTLLDQAHLIGIPVFEGYGLSENGSVVTLNTPRRYKRGTVGRPLPHVQLDVAADGEIILRNPGFLGYLGEEAHPRDFATGDIGRRDDDGFISVVGRKKNIIITSMGRNIAPEWIETELLAQPAVQQAVVFGDDTDRVTALIAPAQNATDDDVAAAIARTNEALPNYAQVARWQRIPTLSVADGTQTGNGRPRRARLQQMYFTATKEQPFFDRLKAETAREQDMLFRVPQIVDGLAGRISRETYIAYLVQAYHHVKHTVPLLREALSHLLPDQSWLTPTLQEYIDEESGHEHWILDDIANAGGDAVAAEHSQPLASTAAMVDYAYRYIRTINPVGMFGMVFVLEGTSIQLASQGAQALMSALKLPPNCFSYLTSHGALDVEHMSFFQDTVNRIESRQDQDAIITMAKAMFELFANMFRAIPHVQGDLHEA